MIYCQVISGHLGWVRSVAVDPSNEWFATGSGDRTIKVSIVSKSEYLISSLSLSLSALGVVQWSVKTNTHRTHQ